MDPFKVLKSERIRRGRPMMMVIISWEKPWDAAERESYL